MESKWNSEKENLIQKILVEKQSYEQIGREYGCSGSNIKKVALRLGIELPKRRKINDSETFNKGIIKVSTTKCLNCGKEFPIYSGSSGKYCSTKCACEHKHKLGYERILNGDPSIMRANWSPADYRIDILNEQNGVCAICGCLPEHNHRPLTFIVDHIDGHASNNRRDNLRCICPNCDSQLDTYKSKNKCGERSYYRYHRSASDDGTEV